MIFSLRPGSKRKGFIVANITSILYTLKCILRAIIENLRAKISFATYSVQVFLTTCKSSGLKYLQPAIKALMTSPPWRALQCLHFRLLKTWRCYSEDIAMRLRDEDITMSSFSLYYAWCNDLRLYNRMIWAIIIMFFYSGIGDP